MYIINFTTYPFRDSLEFSQKSFAVITESQMEQILKETKTKSPELFVKSLNAQISEDTKLRKQKITSITEIKTSKSLPFLEISKIMTSQ